MNIKIKNIFVTMKQQSTCDFIVLITFKTGRLMCLEFSSAGSYLPRPGFFVQSQCTKQIIISSINTKK